MDAEGFFVIVENGLTRRYSSTANGEVTAIELQHSYTPCCSDPVIAWPYMVLADGTQLFSNPPSFHVACNNPLGLGYCPDMDWMERMRAAAISEVVVAKVALYLSRHKAIQEPTE
jgi:hypothetical protein